MGFHNPSPVYNTRQNNAPYSSTLRHISDFYPPDEYRDGPESGGTLRSFIAMNLAMNGLTKEGYEFAGMSTDEIVMQRVVGR
jgi:hypothetical protein